MLKLKPFINKYNWKEIYCPSEKDGIKKFEESNPTVAVNALYVNK